MAPANGNAAAPRAACVFCDIVGGTTRAHEAHRDDVAVVFLDRAPVFPGHALVVPTVHLGTIADLAPVAVGPFFERVRAVAAAVQQAMDAHGTFVALNNTVSQSVPHMHVHVVPRRFKDGLRGFFWPRTRYASEAEAADVAARIGAAMRAAR